MTETQRVYGGLSADQRHARRRRQFLDAGLEVFSRDGWAGSTVTAICSEAGLSARYFYEVVGTREALFLELLGQIADGISAVVRSALRSVDASPEQGTRVVVEALAEHLTGDVRLVRVGLVESLATDEFRVQCRRLIGSFSRTAARLMQALREDSGDDQDLAIRATLLTGGIVEALMLWATGARSAPMDKIVDQVSGLYLAAARL